MTRPVLSQRKKELPSGSWKVPKLNRNFSDRMSKATTAPQSRHFWAAVITGWPVAASVYTSVNTASPSASRAFWYHSVPSTG